MEEKFCANFEMGSLGAKETPLELIANIGIDGATRMLFEGIETELSAISGHDEVEATKHAGRGAGPRFMWKEACGKPGSGRCKQSPLSRAWRLVACWLTQLELQLRQHRPREASSTRW